MSCARTSKEELKELLKTKGLFELDEKQRQVSFTEAGNEHMESVLQPSKDLLKGGSLYDIENVTVVHHVNQALKAHKLFQRDQRLHRQGAARSSSSTSSPAA